MRPLRLLVYDATCRGTGPLPGLTHTWIAGAALYRAMDRFDEVRPVRSWPEAFAWLASIRPDRPIGEIQFWGHGKWGRALVDDSALEASALSADHEWHDDLAAIRDRLTGPDALWWFRTCETFGAEAGRTFARRWTDFFECRAASHTYIIGPLQSGLHVLAPGESPDWLPNEGLAEGTPTEPERAKWSLPGAPNTITCLHGVIPDDIGGA